MLLLTLFAATLIQSSVDIDPARVLREFEPKKYFGGCLDGGLKGSVRPLYKPKNIAAMGSMGIQSLSYRLRTELGCEAWHWNPKGTWSDKGRKQGYWTGSSVPSGPIDLTWGYYLPRRGNTYDQANNDGYSRIDDGDKSTYWKSNPYLDPAYSGDSHRCPEWIVVDLRHDASIDHIRIRWANPFAVRFRVEYWEGEDDLKDNDRPKGIWKVFPNGIRENGKGGVDFFTLGAVRKVRFVRIVLLRSSHTAEPTHYPDLRDKMGFALRELELGRVVDGVLEDAIVHRKDKDQSPTFTSSTDPWHRTTDRDRNTEQPGFDLVYRSGLFHLHSPLLPVSALYGTPEDAQAELKWLRLRHYPVSGLEIGEEPDGQCVDPEHYASLYVQFAKRLKAVAPDLMLGGPCLQRTLADYSRFPNHHPMTWMTRFVKILKDRRQIGFLNFASFEWYPLEKPYGDLDDDLTTSSDLLTKAVANLRTVGLPPNIPWYITEYGYAALAGPKEVDLPDAIINADIAARFLQLGGQAAFQYGFEPGALDSDYDHQWGNLISWLIDKSGNAKYPMPAYWTARMLTTEWCSPKGGTHRLVQSSSSDSLITTYAICRPDQSYSLLLLNKDSRKPRTMSIQVRGNTVRAGYVAQFGKAEYAWKEAGKDGHPIRSLPPTHRPFSGSLVLPPLSVTVVRFRE